MWAYLVLEKEKRECGIYRLLYVDENCPGYEVCGSTHLTDFIQAKFVVSVMNTRRGVLSEDVARILESAGIEEE